MTSNGLRPLGALRDRLIRRVGSRSGELERVQGIDGLGQVPASTAPTSTVQSVCGFCATGCSLTVHLRNGKAVNVTATPTYPVNLGSACPKGWEILAPSKSPDRMMTPLLRTGDSQLESISWEAAAEVFVTRMRAVQREHGAESVAFLSTGQIPTEEMALLGTFAKFEMGMLHGDGNTRQCMATSAVAHKQSFGFDSPPFTYADFEHSDVIVLIGSNLCIAHPILWERVARNPHRPDIVVIDPRRTETAAASTQHLQLRPATDLALLCGLARQIVQLDGLNHDFIAAHTNGFDDWLSTIEPWSLEATEEATGVSTAEIDQLARTIVSGKRVSLWWTMGVNQGHQAVRTAQAIINIALMTGNIGRPGTGANSITGQCNAMGSRLFANTTNLLGGHYFANPAHRAKVADIIGIDESRIPTEASWAYDQILDGIETGKIRALWIIATNTAHSWMHQDRTRRLLDQLDFLVVQDLFADTMTATHADLLLPAAGWGEKDGTFINAERRIGRTRLVTDAPGEARPDFEIFRLLAHAWGSGAWLDRWTSPEAAFGILQELSDGQPCDITGIAGYDQIESAGGVQWPYPAGTTGSAGEAPAVGEAAAAGENERRLFEDGRFFHADGRARFVCERPANPPETATESFPLILLTGRQSSAQWHTGTRTDRSSVLRAIAPRQTTIQIHPHDATSRNVGDGDRVRIGSSRGAMEATAQITTTIPAGSVFVGMHDPAINLLTRWTIDPYSRQPAFKQSCVEVTPT
jgi:anaerobic selenocysteine-containing dehydrogenase